MTSVIPVTITSSTLIYTGACLFHGMLLGTDGVNDPTITVYNNTSAAGNKVVPTATYDASLLGLNGVTGMHQNCNTGIYVAISVGGGGSCEVVVQYSPLK